VKARPNHPLCLPASVFPVLFGHLILRRLEFLLAVLVAALRRGTFLFPFRHVLVQGHVIFRFLGLVMRLFRVLLWRVALLHDLLECEVVMLLALLLLYLLVLVPLSHARGLP
jgi:hypothetical protein